MFLLFFLFSYFCCLLFLFFVILLLFFLYKVEIMNYTYATALIFAVIFHRLWGRALVAVISLRSAWPANGRAHRVLQEKVDKANEALTPHDMVEMEIRQPPLRMKIDQNVPTSRAAVSAISRKTGARN